MKKILYRVTRPIRQHLAGTVLSSMAVVMVLQNTILPGIFDFITDGLIVGMTWAAFRLLKEPDDAD